MRLLQVTDAVQHSLMIGSEEHLVYLLTLKHR